MTGKKKKKKINKKKKKTFISTNYLNKTACAKEGPVWERWEFLMSERYLWEGFGRNLRSTIDHHQKIK